MSNRIPFIYSFRNCVFGVLVWLIHAVASPSQPALPGVSEVVTPPGGAGPVLVLLTGADGAFNHLQQAHAFAGEGWLVHVVDSNRLMAGDPAEGLRSLLKNLVSSQQSPDKRPALVGYSLGGWIVLAYGSRMPEFVTSAVAYYPSTYRIGGDIKSFVTSPTLSVPTLILAGGKDTYMNCCTIERAKALAQTASLPDVRASLQLVEYPEANHGFVLPAYPQVYRPEDEKDAFRRAVAHLRASQTKQ